MKNILRTAVVLAFVLAGCAAPRTETSDLRVLLPESDLSGRPLVLDLALDDLAAGGSDGRGDGIFYRVPRTATARVMDGANMLLQTRIPIYQLGETLVFPIK